LAESEFAQVTPGEMLKEEFLAEHGLSQKALAKAIGISLRTGSPKSSAIGGGSPSGCLRAAKRH
jgi:hypothetical protein